MWTNLFHALSITNENIHLIFLDPPALESDEDQGLSSLQKPALREIWRDGINIYIKFLGNDDRFNLAKFPDYWKQILVILCQGI